MLDVKAAVKLTLTAIPDLFPDAEDIRLEEAQLSDDEKFWLITYSFVRPESSKPKSTYANAYADSLQAMLGGRGRAQKVVRIDSSDGRLLGITSAKP